jgi:hypothetical protein
MLQNINQVLKHNGAVTIGAALLAVWGLGTSAKAVIILPGQTLNTTGEAAPAFGAPLDVEDNVPFLADDFFGDEAFAGDLNTSVYADPTTGDLDFVYQFTNTFLSGDPILHLSVSSFAGWSTDADYLTGTGTGPDDVPTSVTRNPDNGGATLDFSFPSGVTPGTESAEVIVKTSAPVAFFDDDGTAALQDGGNISVTAPATVPEPATAAIAAFALSALCIRRRKIASN